jgi:hypothetical protein
MARLVRFEASSSIKIDPATWPKDAAGNLNVLSICACGLSSTFPICDGSHKKCREEKPGMVYRYDPLTKEVIEERPESA